MATGDQQVPSWLLLLTTAPSNISLASFKATIQPALTQSLQAVAAASKATAEVKTLDVAVSYTTEHYARGDPQSSQYQCLQGVVGQMYKLICIVCTQLDIDIDHGNDVDVRIILYENKINDRICPFSLQSLATSKRPWQNLFTINCAEGESLLRSFLQNRKGCDAVSSHELNIERVDPGTDPTNSRHSEHGEGLATGGSATRHYSVAVGGTFDHLHVGHKLLLTMTALVLEPDTQKRKTLTVGITGDSLLKKKKYIEELQSWDQRQRSVRNFLLSILEQDPPKDPASRTFDRETSARVVRDELKSGLIIDYVEIFDALGPTITDETISALVISGETRSGGKAVNDRREEKGWAPLEVFEVDVLDALGAKPSGSADTDFQDKISSTDIRRRVHLGHARRAAPTV